MSHANALHHSVDIAPRFSHHHRLCSRLATVHTLVHTHRGSTLHTAHNHHPSDTTPHGVLLRHRSGRPCSMAYRPWPSWSPTRRVWARGLSLHPCPTKGGAMPSCVLCLPFSLCPLSSLLSLLTLPPLSSLLSLRSVQFSSVQFSPHALALFVCLPIPVLVASRAQWEACDVLSFMHV